jgi:hypothetical protein
MELDCLISIPNCQTGSFSHLIVDEKMMMML